MILKDGDELEIGGKQGIICFNAEFEGDKYICVAFEGKELSFDIYEYKYENNKLLVGKVEDPKEMEEVLKIMIKENIESIELPDEIKKGFAQLIEKFKE